jgi:hypothetical protein
MDLMHYLSEIFFRDYSSEPSRFTRGIEEEVCVSDDSIDHKINGLVQTTIKGIGFLGRRLETQDGTIWKVPKKWGELLLSRWREGDVVIVTTNPGISSREPYIIENRIAAFSDSGESNQSRPLVEVPAKLSEGPFSTFAIFIKAFNGNEISLSNDSVWTVSLWNGLGAFRNWELEDAVLIGKTGNYCSPKCILINVNKNNFVPVDLKTYDGL